MSKNIQRILFFFIFLTSQISKAQECNVIYVSPGGANSGAAGTKSNPASLQYGLTLVSAGNSRLHLRAGTYNISTEINLVSNCRIEGGYNANWQKTNGSETIIFRDFTNPSPNPSRLIAVSGGNLTNFELHDITIKTANAIGNGVSTYGMYLSGCSNYELVRVKIQAGNATSGNIGGPGANGVFGANGLAGQPGDEDGPCCTAGGLAGSGSFAGSNPGGNGGDGGPRGTYSFPTGGSAPPGFAGNAAPGAGGGYPGLGGVGVDDRIISIVSCPRTSLNDGTNGTAGLNGQNGMAGGNGAAAFAGGYYQPAQGLAGQDGTNGFGGGGGGGGGSQGYVVVIPAIPLLGIPEINNNGSGAGGGGGGEGGQGASGGQGGTGGGGSFGLFLWNNGPNSVIRDCNIFAGNYGIGGLGGPGGVGGNGGLGGAGGGQLNCDVGAGGNGGNGGKGGNGGNGGKGSDGVSINIYQSPTGNPIQILNINSLQQPVVTITSSGCVNSPITFHTNQSGTIQWYFGANSSPASSFGQTAVASYTSAGEKTFTMVWNGIPYTYTEFIEIYNTNASLSPTIISGDSVLCLGQSGTYQSSITANNYEWNISGGLNSINQTITGSGFQTLQNFQFPAPGIYQLSLKTFSICCGESFTAFYQVKVDSIIQPSIYIQSAIETNSYTICEGVNVIYTASAYQAGSNPTYSWSLNGNNVGTNSPTFINNTPTTGDIVTCTVTSTLGCSAGQSAVSNSIPVTVISTPVINCNADSFFTFNPTYFNANVASGGLAPFSYEWNFGNNSFGVGASVATVYPTAGNYNVQVNVTDANGCTGSCNLLVQIGNYFQVDFVSNKFNGCSPLQVQFTNQSINALTYLWDFGDGSTSNLEHPMHVYQSPGTYNVSLAGFSATGNLIQTVNNQIMVFPSPTANFLYYSTGTAPVGDTVYFADNSINAWTWDWNFGDPTSGALNVSNLQNPVHYYSTNNNFTVTLKVSNNYGCIDSITKQNYVVVNTGVENSNSNTFIKIYPNPFTDEIVLEGYPYLKNFSYILQNSLGQTILNGKISSSKTSTHLPLPANLPEGLYYLSLTGADMNQTIKLIHQSK